MAVTREHYEGRYEALVKHEFLRHYLPALANKVASRWDTLVYVDGFAGPWKSADTENYSDTSFGIALEAMLAAQMIQLGRQRRVRMVAHLVEKHRDAFLQLKTLRAKYPTIEVIPYHGEFENFVPEIVAKLNSSDFCYSFIDPKGFGINLEGLKPLISRTSSEVFVNFMFDYANRFVDHPNQRVKDTINSMMSGVEWRDRLDGAASSNDREAIFLDAFKLGLRQTGGFNFVPSLTVQKTFADRTYYHMVFGTRSPVGLEVFRDSQIKALTMQAEVRASEKSKARTKATGQIELFAGTESIPYDPSSQEIADGKTEGVSFAIQVLEASPNGIVWSKLWPMVLERFTIRRVELQRAINELRKSGKIDAPGWPTAQHSKPQDQQLFRVKVE
jgi:three-Cys-motif partner protein